MLLSESGQVPAENEPGPEGGEPTPEGDPAPEAEPAPEGDGGAPAGDGQPAKQPQDFLSESKKRTDIMARINGNPELKTAYGWMQSAYQKQIQGKRELVEKASIVDRFYSDPNFATQTVQQWAAQNGYALTRGQAQQIAQANGAPATSGANDVPPQYVEAVKGYLPQELQWMAPSIAAASFAANQAMLKPLQDRAEQQTKTQREQQYNEMAGELAQQVPGWEEYEDEMSELLDFLSSDKMTHKKFGSKLRLLYDVVTKNAVATQDAAKRMSSAARNRTSSGQAVKTNTNIQDRIRKAKNMDEAFDIAAKAAEEELQRNGNRVLT